MAKKIQKLDLSASLLSLKRGESLTFRIAGANAETSYNSLHSTKCKLGLNNLSILTLENGLTAKVIAL